MPDRRPAMDWGLVEADVEHKIALVAGAYRCAFGSVHGKNTLILAHPISSLRSPPPPVCSRGIWWTWGAGISAIRWEVIRIGVCPLALPFLGSFDIWRVFFFLRVLFGEQRGVSPRGKEQGLGRVAGDIWPAKLGRAREDQGRDLESECGGVSGPKRPWIILARVRSAPFSSPLLSSLLLSFLFLLPGLLSSSHFLFPF